MKPVPAIFSYQDCLDFLYARNQFAMKLGLQNIADLLAFLNSPPPHTAGRYIHVAGTNGKGSVCCNLAHLLPLLGYKRVGLYTSPHLVSFRERIRIDGAPIPQDWIVTWLQRTVTKLVEMGATYFECVTAMALDYFHAARCEIVVLETGLGGRLDATNIVTPELCLITSVSLDHTDILGETVEKIWTEKLGILKAGVPVVVDEDRASLLSLLSEKASPLGCPVYNLRDYPFTAELPGGKPLLPSRHESGKDVVFKGEYGAYSLPGRIRRGLHQWKNTALSLLALEILGGTAVPTASLARRLDRSRMPGRTQLLRGKGVKPVLLDGAHNPGGMQSLAEYILEAFPGWKITALFSVMRDKDVSEVVGLIRGFAGEAYFLPLDKHVRALRHEELAGRLGEGFDSIPKLDLSGGALERLLAAEPRGKKKNNGNKELLVVCGSLYLLGEIIPRLLRHYPGLAFFRQFADE